MQLALCITEGVPLGDMLQGRNPKSPPSIDLTKLAIKVRAKNKELCSCCWWWWLAGFVVVLLFGLWAGVVDWNKYWYCSTGISSAVSLHSNTSNCGGMWQMRQSKLGSSLGKILRCTLMSFTTCVILGWSRWWKLLLPLPNFVAAVVPWTRATKTSGPSNCCNWSPVMILWRLPFWRPDALVARIQWPFHRCDCSTNATMRTNQMSQIGLLQHQVGDRGCAQWWW